MNPCLFCLPILLFVLSACVTIQPRPLPELTTTENQERITTCGQFFPSGNWQLVHSIDFTMRSGNGSTVMGVTTLTGSEIGCALITVEGLTLFEAVYHPDNGVEIRRAIPPFDKPAFAEGLLSDVRAIFLPPAMNAVQVGYLSDTTPVCRYTAADGRVTDVLTTNDCFQIQNYASNQTLTRSIVGKTCKKTGSLLLPEHLDLNTFGPNGYALKMTLISADKLQ